MTKDNDTAFCPSERAIEAAVNSNYGREFRDINMLGLTKREYFATMAMQGLLSAGSNRMPSWEEIAQYSVEAADYLIIALNKKEIEDAREIIDRPRNF